MFVKTTGVSLIKGRGEASCYGDSGGPLFVGDQQTIVGVTSFHTAPPVQGTGLLSKGGSTTSLKVGPLVPLSWASLGKTDTLKWGLIESSDRWYTTCRDQRHTFHPSSKVGP